MEALLRYIQHFVDAGPQGLAFVLDWLIVVAPAAVLHELGHAVAARRRLGGHVIVVVGANSKEPGLRIGGIEFRLSPLVRPWRFDAYCAYERRNATPADTAVISLAGPAASATGALVSLFMLGHSAGFAHDLWWMAFGQQLGSLLLCIVPMSLSSRRGGPVFHTDGKIALDALRRPRPV